MPLVNFFHHGSQHINQPIVNGMEAVSIPDAPTGPTLHFSEILFAQCSETTHLGLFRGCNTGQHGFFITNIVVGRPRLTRSCSLMGRCAYYNHETSSDVVVARTPITSEWTAFFHSSFESQAGLITVTTRKMVA